MTDPRFRHAPDRPPRDGSISQVAEQLGMSRRVLEYAVRRGYLALPLELDAVRAYRERRNERMRRARMIALIAKTLGVGRPTIRKLVREGTLSHPLSIASARAYFERRGMSNEEAAAILGVCPEHVSLLLRQRQLTLPLTHEQVTALADARARRLTRAEAGVVGNVSIDVIDGWIKRGLLAHPLTAEQVKAVAEKQNALTEVPLCRAAAYLGVSIWWIRDRIDKGELQRPLTPAMLEAVRCQGIDVRRGRSLAELGMHLSQAGKILGVSAGTVDVWIRERRLILPLTVEQLTSVAAERESQRRERNVA